MANVDHGVAPSLALSANGGASLGWPIGDCPRKSTDKKIWPGSAIILSCSAFVLYLKLKRSAVPWRATCEPFSLPLNTTLLLRLVLYLKGGITELRRATCESIFLWKTIQCGVSVASVDADHARGCCLSVCLFVQSANATTACCR